MKKLSLTIGWLYPELMSTYGDRGNIIVLQKRCEWRGVDVKINRISIETNLYSLFSSDLIFMGGAQDAQQEIVNEDLFGRKGNTLRKLIEDNVPGLYICGAYQFLGRYYRTANGIELPGLGIFPTYTENPGEHFPRLIGNVIIEPTSSRFNLNQPQRRLNLMVGFENHGGKTYLEDKSMAFAKVVKGHGNNGEDKTEGIIYKNSIGTYLHGPILPKNPELADWLIQKALEKKYKEKNNLEHLDNSLEEKAKDVIVNRHVS